MHPRLVHTAAAAVASAVLLSGCGRDVEPSDTYHPVRGVSVELSWTGGLCPDGVCNRSVTVGGDREDGTTTWSGDEGRTGPADPDATADLFGFVDASFDGLVAEEFTGTCPTAYDGKEVLLGYQQLPTGPDAHLADAVSWTTSTCEHEWPDGFVDELHARWDATGAPWPLAPTGG